MIVTMVTLLLLPGVGAVSPLRVVGVPLAGIFVQDRAVLVFQAAPCAAKSANIGRSSGGRASHIAIVEGGHSAHPRGQLLEQTRAGVAQHLRDARRSGRTRIATSRSRGRALPRGRHVVARRKYEHLGRLCSPEVSRSYEEAPDEQSLEIAEKYRVLKVVLTDLTRRFHDDDMLKYRRIQKSAREELAEEEQSTETPRLTRGPSTQVHHYAGEA